MEGRASAEEFDRLLSTVLPTIVRDSAVARLVWTIVLMPRPPMSVVARHMIKSGR